MISANLHQRTILGICGGLVILFILSLSYTLWQWRLDWQLAHQQPTVQPIMTKSNTNALIIMIPEAHLFGQALPQLGQVPITNLQLTVTGIVKKLSDKAGGISKAYISISGEPSKIYQVGDSLPYGVKVYDITANTVILENNGRLEKLLLPREGLKFKPKYKYT